MIKFLIIRFSSIGDIVLTTPVVRCLKNQVEGGEIHFLTKKDFLPVVKNNPYIDKIHVLESDFSVLIKKLKEENFHYIIDLHNNLRTFRIKNRLNIISFSFNKLNIRKWIMVNFKINILPNIHIVDRYFKTMEVFDVHNDGNGLDYFISREDEVNISEISHGLLKGYVAMAVGAKHNTKQIPETIMTEICNNINYPVVLLGGKEDFEKAENVRTASKGDVINLCGKLSINRSASIVKQSMLVISPDTGLMHIAAAYKKKIISIWGNTIPEFGMFPYLPHPSSKIFEIKGLSCRPCSKIGYNKCPRGHFKCMNNHNTELISETINTLANS